MNSVLGQNYASLEYVVIDGGSTDGSVDIIRRHAGKLAYWVSEPDGGHGEALNKGFARTTGDIMAWINSDDMYLPWTLRTVADIFSEFPDVHWVQGFNSFWSDRGFLTTANRSPKNIYDFMLGRYHWIQQESVFWRRSLWEKAGGRINPAYRLMVDGDLWARFMLHAELVTVDCIWGGYRFHGANRAVHHMGSCLKEMDDIICSLKENCSAMTRSKCRQLGRINRIVNSKIGRLLSMPDLANRVFKTLLTSTGYKNIFYSDGRWQTRILPFAFNKMRSD